MNTNINYDQLMFTESRLAVIEAPKGELSESQLVKSMTINEELVNLGYKLAPADVIRLAKSSSLDGFFSQIKKLIGYVKASPMYPYFPAQVMSLSEAQLRFHQMLHYASTYGMEYMMGEPVLKGWLPYPDSEEKTEEDTVLLEAKVIGLITEDEKYIVPMKKILGKAERMTGKERMVVSEAVKNVPVSALEGLTVKFKQNLFDVFYAIFSAEEIENDQKLSLLHSICQHTGDVWKCIDYTLTREDYHFRTSQKKLLVRLLESYSVGDFEANIVLSDKKAARVGLVVNYLSYNKYSNSEPHKKVVSSLRNGELRSWESKVVKLIDASDPAAIDLLAKRPGVLLRHLAMLVRRGYSVEKLTEAMTVSADKLSVQTLITVLTFFGRDDKVWGEQDRCEEAHKVFDICLAALKKRLSTINTKFAGKKIYIDTEGYSAEMSRIECNDKSSEGGYIRSGLAIKLPDNIHRIRFFVYWNDKRRVDVDMHASALRPDGSYAHIGWDGQYTEGEGELVFSGDITHSDAAEYIDVEMNPKAVSTVSANIDVYCIEEERFSYKDNPTFKDIDECFVGIMAVDKLGQEVKLYNPSNCFFTHYLTSAVKTINYGYIDVKNRVLIYDGKGSANGWYSQQNHGALRFNLKSYLDILSEAQGSTVVSNREEADYVLVMEKPTKENELSILDNNFFIDPEG